MTPWLLGLALAGPGGEGLERFVAGDREGAYPLLVQGTEEEADDLPAEAWLFRGAHERAEGDWPLAATTFRAGLQQHPTHHALQLELATTLSWMGAHDEALAAYDAVLAAAERDTAAHAAAAEGRARVMWWSGRRDRALSAARDLPDERLANEILADRPRELTVLAGLRAADTSSPRVGLRGSLRHRPWTLYGSIDRDTTAWSLGQGQAGWAGIGGVARRLGDHVVVDGSVRRWWTSDSHTQAVAGRLTTPVAGVSPYLGGMVGTGGLRIGETGLRVGKERIWASAGLTHRLTAEDPARATTLAAGLGGAVGPLTLRLDGSRGWFFPGPLDSVGAAVKVDTGKGHSWGVELTHLTGWLTRTDALATWSLAF